MKKLAAAITALLLAHAYLVATEQELEAAVCGTDTECAEHCPPPADEPDCDGGPQS